MRSRIAFALALLTGVVAILRAESVDLVVEGLHEIYASVSDVHLTLRNTALLPVNLDSFQVDLLLVDRLAEDGKTWRRGQGFVCANAGVGTPRAIGPGRTMEVQLLESLAFRPEKAPEYFEAETGEKAPLSGRYRVTVRYSPEPWSDITHVPGEIKTAVSAEFEVK